MAGKPAALIGEQVAEAGPDRRPRGVEPYSRVLTGERLGPDEPFPSRQDRYTALLVLMLAVMTILASCQRDVETKEVADFFWILGYVLVAQKTAPRVIIQAQRENVRRISNSPIFRSYHIHTYSCMYGLVHV